MSAQLSRLLGRHGSQPVGHADYRHVEPVLNPAHSPEDEGEDVKALIELGKAMVGADVGDPVRAEENPEIPAGYTYLGQFIDHDLSFNPVSDLRGDLHLEQLRNARSPSLDLDSIYGLGPVEQPYFYDDVFVDDAGGGRGAKRKVGTRLVPGSGLVEAWGGSHKGFDLPRQQVGGSSYQEPVRAVVPDPRNDENRIVAQIHSVLLQLHNRQLESAPAGQPAQDRFQFAQQQTRWRYQWVVVHDYLPRIVGAATVDSILEGLSTGGENAGRRPGLRLWDPKPGAVWIPVEFAAAAFRFGHSMVRPSYHISKGLRQKRSNQPIPILGRPAESLLGRTAMPADWAFDWDFFFPGGDPSVLQSSLRIDTLVSKPLFNLSAAGIVSDGVSQLPVRTLRRGAHLGLPSGETMARLLGVTPLSQEQLYERQSTSETGHFARRVDLSSETSARLRDRTPLWYYVLREAELQESGRRLGPVGGRIVAEVLIGLLFADKDSFMGKQWTPREQSPESWGMRELIDEATG
jgi:hypothetical protein